MVNGICNAHILNKCYKQYIYSVSDSIDVTKHDVLSIKELKNKLNNCIECYNYEEVNVLKNVLDFLKGKNSKNKIYFKLARDKFNNLIALYFNIDNFIEKGAENILLFTDKKLSGRTFLYMSIWNKDSKFIKPFRDNVAHVNINEFRSFYPKMGHGSYILKNLDYIIKEVNKLIDFNYEGLYPLKSITGIVVPMTKIIPFEDLVKLYQNYGFSTIGQKKSDGRDRTIIIKFID